MASAVTKSLVDELIAGVESTKENVNARGEETIKTVAQVTTEGLQGESALAAEDLSHEIERTLANVNDILTRYEHALAEYTENFNAGDRCGAAQLGGC